MEREDDPPEQESDAAGGRADRPGDDPPVTWVAWKQIGRQALHMEPRAQIKTLRDISRACEELVIIETWLAHAENITHTAEALAIGRRRVSQTVKAWRNAQALERPGRVIGSGEASAASGTLLLVPTRRPSSSGSRAR